MLQQYCHINSPDITVFFYQKQSLHPDQNQLQLKETIQVYYVVKISIYAGVYWKKCLL